MAGMFDWLKGGKSRGKVRRRSSGGVGRKISGKPKRRGAKQDSSKNATEFMGPQRDNEPPELIPPVPAPTPDLPLPNGPSRTADNQQNSHNPAHDSNATHYSVAPAKGGLVGILIVKEGVARDEIYKVYNGTNTIGRDSAAEIRLDNRDTTVSRKHAEIFHESGNFGIKPLQEGKNPTFKNNNEVTGGDTLADGDLIRVGNTTMKFRVC